MIIILAATVILTISKNNPVESAKEAKFKEDIRTFQDELALSIAKDNAEKQLNRNDKFNAITFDEIKNYIPSFMDKYKDKFIIKEDELIYVEENVTENEKKWLTDLIIGVKEKFAKVVATNPTEYYGKVIINYSANGVSEWKVFYSDGSNVYIIASDYVDVGKLPAPLNGGSKPENTNTSYSKSAALSNVLVAYNGSSNITEEKIKALNNDYFSKGYTSKSPNMQAVAYLLDTKIWSSFVDKKVAEYAIGGPTVEMLMSSYSKSYNVEFRARASDSIGYQISKDGGINWSAYYGAMLRKNDNLYVLMSSNDAYGMWLASPSAANTLGVVTVQKDGNLTHTSANWNFNGFRPIVCLKSNVTLESVEGGFEIK